MNDATKLAEDYAAGIVHELTILDLICEALDPDDLAGRIYDLSADGDDLNEIRTEYLDPADPMDATGRQLAAEAVGWIIEHADELSEWDGRAALTYMQTAVLEVVEYGHRSTSDYRNDWIVDRVELLRTVGGPDARISVDADDPDRVTVRVLWGGGQAVRRIVLPAAGPALFDETPAGIE